MSTDKQITANRRNAAKSTGPRSQSGKSRSNRNALKHGLSAERVVMFNEDPAVFEALRSDLVGHFRPADPVADHLVEQVAACIWRLRRVPEIEARIYEHFRNVHERNESARMAQFYVSRPEVKPYARQGSRNKEDHAAATDVQQRAEAKKLKDTALMGGMFAEAERSLNSLVRIASAIESSMYRAIRELERIKAERQDTAGDSAVIEVELDEDEDWLN